MFNINISNGAHKQGNLHGKDIKRTNGMELYTNSMGGGAWSFLVRGVNCTFHSTNKRYPGLLNSAANAGPIDERFLEVCLLNGETEEKLGASDAGVDRVGPGEQCRISWVYREIQPWRRKGNP